MHTDENKKFDKRNIQRNIKEGLINQKDYENYLSKLQNVSDNIFHPEESGDDSEGIEQKREIDSQSKKKELKKKGKGKGK